MAPEFRPGTFEPVITVSQRGDGLTRAFHGDNEGLYEVCLDTFKIGYSASLAVGGASPYNRISVEVISKILAQYLWCRNLANQLAFTGQNIRFGKEFQRSFPLPEPIVKLFNAYGHAHHEEVNYVQLDLERQFCWAVFNLLDMTKDTDFDVDDMTVDAIDKLPWTRRLSLTSAGEIEIRYTQSISEYLTDLVAHISGLNIDPEHRLRYIKSIIDVATERDLRLALSFLRQQPDIGQLPARRNDTPDQNFADKIREIFGDHAPTQEGTVLDSKHINKTIHRISEMLRTACDELFPALALATIPKYEQGSLAQLSETTDDLTFSHFPLSLADLTVSAGFKVGRVLRRFLRAAPEITDIALRSELIRKSVRRRA